MENTILKNNSEASSELTNEQLVAILKNRVESGEISQEVLASEVKAQNKDQAKGKFDIKSLYMYIASGLVYLGLIFIVGINWQSLSEASRLLITLGTGLFLVIFCNLIGLKKLGKETKTLVSPILGSSLIASAILYYSGLSIFITSSFIQTTGIDKTLAFLIGSIIFSAICVFFSSLKANRENGLLFLLTIVTSYLSFIIGVNYVIEKSFWDQKNTINEARINAWSNLVYGVFVFGLVFKNWNRQIAKFINILNSCFVMIVVAILIFIETTGRDSEDILNNWIEFLYIIVLTIFFVYAKKINSIVLSIATGVITFIWMFYINTRYFNSNTAFAIVLVVCGIAGIIFGIVQTLRQKKKTT